MGPDRHVLTFMVDHGETLNLVAFVTTKEPWPDSDHLTPQGTREDALKAFADFGPGIRDLIRLTKDHPDRVSCGECPENDAEW
jgi:salicylate hydroxylase